MVKDSRIGGWLKSVGRRFGIGSVQPLEEGREERLSQGCPDFSTGTAIGGKPDCPARRSQVDSEACRLVAQARSQMPRLTAGEIAKRAEQRLTLIPGGLK